MFVGNKNKKERMLWVLFKFAPFVMEEDGELVRVEDMVERYGISESDVVVCRTVDMVRATLRKGKVPQFDNDDLMLSYYELENPGVIMDGYRVVLF